MENKAEMGEMALFLIGAVLSILLVSVLFFPFVTKFKVRTRARVRGMGHHDLVGLVGNALARAGFSVTQVELPPQHRPPHARTPETIYYDDVELRAAKGANCFHVRVTAPEEVEDPEALIELVLDGQTPAQRAAMTVLTGTPLAWCALTIDTALKRARLKPGWTERDDQAPALAPLTATKRLVVMMSPWH